MSKRDYPLRKVEQEYSKMTYKSMYGEIWEHYELLECGHEIRTPRDFIGETSAMKRRCKEWNRGFTTAMMCCERDGFKKVEAE